MGNEEAMTLVFVLQKKVAHPRGVSTILPNSLKSYKFGFKNIFRVCFGQACPESNALFQARLGTQKHH